MQTHIIHIQKWAHPYAPTETELYQQMVSEGLSPYKWSSDPQEIFSAHAHAYGKVIYVVSGSITFGFPIDGEPTILNPGDRLELPAGIRHNAVAGINGVACLEAQSLVK
jgi:quercetin dioxygenase-like cupin family protein